jgi:cell division protein FtsB
LVPVLAKAIQQLESLFDSDHDALAKLKADNDNLRATKDNEAAQIKVLTQRADALESAHR